MKNLFDNLFIFEMANNHQGSVEHGIKIIREMAKIARKYDINAGVKLQYRDLDTFIHPDYVGSKEIKHIPRFLGTRLNPSQFLTLVQAIKDEGMVSICTPFDEASVSLIMDHGIQIIKIASCSANDWSLLEAVSKTRKPVIASTGGLYLNQIDNLVSFLTHRDVSFALLHCVGLYPAPNENVNANFIDKLKKRFSYLPIGYSGHEAPDNTDVIKIAVAKRGQIFERHVGVETDTIKLNAYSMNPLQVENWVKSATEALSICGDEKDKKVAQSEIDSLRSLMRGAYAKTAIKKGEPLSMDKIFFAIPCIEDQTSAFEHHETMIAARDYEPNSPLFERRGMRSKIDLIRGVVHEIKGMLHEANIVVGKEFRIELSHHYGMDHFRQFGAVIMDIINRSYCKKLVIVIPGQQHPTHWHKIKEETFQLLWGDLEIKLNGNQVFKMKPGDSLLVEPNTPHSFSSFNGAIIEEVSTTHIKGDSVYEDEVIDKKDLLERKTIIEDW
jgi:sialic acid synthase SpsE/mannose-6-phosphate isomerase-like protein (cupin superfamily)